MSSPLSSVCHRVPLSTWLIFFDTIRLEQPTLTLPVLFFQAMRDIAIIPTLSIGMEKNVPNMIRRQVDSGHWALIQVADEINKTVAEWIKEVVWAGKSTL